MALVLLLVGALLVVAGVATISIGAAMICGGLLTMAGAVAGAAAQDRVTVAGRREKVE